MYFFSATKEGQNGKANKGYKSDDTKCMLWKNCFLFGKEE